MAKGAKVGKGKPDGMKKDGASKKMKGKGKKVGKAY